MDNATKIADAIELVLAARFVLGEMPTDGGEELGAVYGFVSHVDGLGRKGLELRSFQKAGISSALVAKALRAGVLWVQEGGG